MRSAFLKNVLCAQSCPTLWGLTEHKYSWLTFTSPGNLHDPGIKPMSLASSALAGRLFATAQPGKTLLKGY